MDFKGFCTLIYEHLPIQAMRLEATEVYIKYKKEYQDIDVTFTENGNIGDITINPDGSWDVNVNIADELNAFQHAYTSAKFAYNLGAKKHISIRGC